MREILRLAVTQGALRAVDFHFALHLAGLAGAEEPDLLLAAALASHRVGEGDVCVDLSGCAELELFRTEGIAGRVSVPNADEWAESLRRSPVVGVPGQLAPLILDHSGRLYLGRYWHFEHILAEALSKRTGVWMPAVDRDRLRVGLARLFPQQDGVDWQRVAAAMAVLRPFCVISGGPGTGKTRTVTSILALLAEQNGAGPPSRIALAAPTGKAAARLTESIRVAKTELKLAPTTATRIPEQAVTLHRLLGFRPGRANPRHGPDNPLHLDILVVDEASMVDLPLMARLFQAMPARARMILLGDKDQLSSVEAGMVLGDICGRGARVNYGEDFCEVLSEVAGLALPPAEGGVPGIADHIVELRKSWRFGADSGIGRLAGAVNRGDPSAAMSVLDDAAYPDATREEPARETLDRVVWETVVPAYRQVLAAEDPTVALKALNGLRVLCAVREGPYGVRSLNRRIERALEECGLIQLAGEVYSGRPVMVTANDHAQRLYNGDVGLVLPDLASGGALRVFFETAEGVRRILPSRLPSHETVYAMTVHKSQGSEFDRVLLVLPEAESRVVTRELVYTGLTRARQAVTLVASTRQLQSAIECPTRRSSGLYEALWGA